VREVFIPPAVRVCGFVSPPAAAPAELDVLRAVDRMTETANGRTNSAIRSHAGLNARSRSVTMLVQPERKYPLRAPGGRHAGSPRDRVHRHPARRSPRLAWSGAIICGALCGRAGSCLLGIKAEDRPPAVHGQDGAVDEGGVL
jgi:hypothetical protein